VLIDFHTHTTASDGALSPEELMDRARSRGIRLFAITDHDTVSGYQAAAAHYSPCGEEMSLVAGLEFSCVWSGATIHVVGLGVDSAHPVCSRAWHGWPPLAATGGR
jgi:3',5'-nucleoside bisphosphate phosphatase